MTILAFRVFGGEVPRLPETLLPENAAQWAWNCDLAHGELRGLRGDKTVFAAAWSWNGATGQIGTLKTVYTEDGKGFWGWTYDVYAVKSLTVDDLYYRVYYTSTLSDGPLAKVARTKRDPADTPSGGRWVIGPNGLVPQFYPPEYTTPGGYGNQIGPDSWILGVPAPKVQADIPEDNLVAELEDKPEWPDAPRLRLRVTMFYEDVAGNIVSQTDISNNETAKPSGKTWDNIFYTVAADETRGNKLQDMLWPLSDYLRQQPYKFYFFIPPALDLTGLTKPVTIVNPGTNVATFDFDTSSAVDPVPPPKVIVA